MPVDELIISPISRRRREEDAPPVHKNEGKSAPPAAPDRAPSQTPPTGESSANADELPVWLL
jgi:hypothetical protein